MSPDLYELQVDVHSGPGKPKKEGTRVAASPFSISSRGEQTVFGMK